jgi:hypothetical protein
MSPAAGPAPVIHHHQFSHPAAIFNQFVVSLVDHSLLKLCQDGDVGTMSRHDDTSPSITKKFQPGASTPSMPLGKSKHFFSINVSDCAILCIYVLFLPISSGLLVVEEKELLDLLSNFLIEISGSIFTASFKFRRPADPSFLY